jgi:hypothetical protein
VWGTIMERETITFPGLVFLTTLPTLRDLYVLAEVHELKLPRRQCLFGTAVLATSGDEEIQKLP